MKPKILLCLALALCGVMSGCSGAVESRRQYLVSYGEPALRPNILSYSKPSPFSLERIKIERVSLTKDQLQILKALAQEQDGQRRAVAG